MLPVEPEPCRTFQRRHERVPGRTVVAARALWERSTTYAAVGATKAADLLQYPPRGFRPIERRARLGHGADRFAYAASAVMTWGVQRGAGFIVDAMHSPAAVTDQTYTPVGFDEAGEPVEPASMSSAEQPDFGPDGAAFVVPGDTAWLKIPLGPLRIKSPVRVVYVVNEPNRIGFAYGTLPGHPENGEEAWIIDQTKDGSVWMTIRAFSRPANFFWWLGYPALRLVQEFYTRRYLRALAGPIPE